MVWAGTKPELGPRAVARLSGLIRHAQHAQEETAEHRLHAQHHEREAPQGITHRDLHVERPPALPSPLDDQPDVEGHTEQEQTEAGEDAALEVEPIEQAYRE